MNTVIQLLGFGAFISAILALLCLGCSATMRQVDDVKASDFWWRISKVMALVATVLTGLFLLTAVK